MLTLLARLGQQRRYWVFLVLAGVALESAALYYQYALDEWPCALCIHVRIWVAAFILLGIAGLFASGSTAASRVLHGLNVIVMLGLAERSYQVLAVERGWTFGDCAMDLGMPAWFALDKWIPWLFEVQTTCGYSPYIVGKITMAEILMVLAVLLAIMAAGVFAASWLREY